MKPATFSDFDRAAFGDQKVVDALPSTWKEAIAAYVEHRSAQVKAPLMDLKGTTEFQARDISYQCAALQEIAKRLGADMKKKPTVKIVETERTLRTQNEIDLGNLLTPEGWREMYKPVLDAIHKEAETSILKNENIRHNQALGHEIGELQAFLSRIESRAAKAVAKLEQEKRGASPRYLENPRRMAI